MKPSSTVWELDNHGNFPRKVSYSLPPKEALRNFIMQVIRKDPNWWNYPETVDGMRKTTFGWVYDLPNGNVVAAYPDR